MKWDSNMVNNNTVTFATFETLHLLDLTAMLQVLVKLLFYHYTQFILWGIQSQFWVFKDNLPFKMDYFSV